TIQVGDKPSGGAVLPGDAEYAVAVRGTNRVALINTASHRVVETIGDGIGEGPFSVVVSPEATLAFVNNTASHDVSVIKLADRRIVARIPIGEIPIVIAVHPSGETLWVSSEGSHRVSVLDIPRGMRRRAPAEHPPSVPGRSTEVAVFGMIHGRHRTSRAWGLDQVRETILRLKPDFVCAEIPPDRWERIWSDYTERGVIEDDRVKLFPEYTDLLLSLSVKTGLRIIPCAGWTKEMSDLRRERIKQFNTDPAHAARHDEYESRLAAVQARYDHPLDDIDDPFLIHSDEYDRRMKEELSLYDEYLNDWIGPGGWSNINEAHMKLIDKAIREHPGRRILITFGAGHKYWFLKRLRARSDIELLDIRPFLPAGPRR
ncbi:MAG: YncE family protein, partial [Acidobacteriota bacterium]